MFEFEARIEAEYSTNLSIGRADASAFSGDRQHVSRDAVTNGNATIIIYIYTHLNCFIKLLAHPFSEKKKKKKRKNYQWFEALEYYFEAFFTSCCFIILLLD